MYSSLRGKERLNSPWRFDVFLFKGKELLLHFFPAFQTAPQPIGVHHMQVSAALGLPHFLCACIKSAEVQSDTEMLYTHALLGALEQNRAKKITGAKRHYRITTLKMFL